MNKLIIFVGILLIVASTGVWLKFHTIRDWYYVPNREPIDGSILPDRAMKAVCVLGWPVMVTWLDKDLENRFVIFPGPIRENPTANSKVYNYAGYYVSTPLNKFADSVVNVETLNGHTQKSLPDEVKKYQLRKIHGLPEDLPKVVELIGPWDLKIHRSKPKRLRLVWKQKMCIGDKFIHGLWVEAIDNKIIKTRALSNPKALERYFSP